ncbi:hypothetical protein [Vulcanisaeta distributa]|uniref:hypothetical protein n=1 Tax=Vulcanisaeta distributa TaxID=164451 RepID=UPI001FB1EEA1|nr:hypothetical protein [Vulcanisaeta distributa]
MPSFMTISGTYQVLQLRLITWGSFQDAYASYITYEWEKGRNISLPGDTLFVAGSGNGYEPGYWTDVVDFSPGSLICTKSMTYVVSMNIFYHLGFNVPIASQSYVCSKAMISLFSMGGAASDGFGVINATWYYKPYLANVTEATLAVEGGGFTPVGTAYVPRPTAYTVPISVFAKLSAGHCGLFDLFTRHVYVSYYLDWLVWINVTSLFGRPGRLPIYYSHGILSSGNYTSNGFYIEAQCG